MILFFGAGASKPFDIPVTRDFALEIVESLAKRTGAIPDLLSEVKQFFGEQFDLEVLLTLLDDLSRENPFDIISPVTTQFILSKADPKEYTLNPEVHRNATSLFTSVLDEIRQRVLTKTREKKGLIIQVYDQVFTILSRVTGSSTRPGDAKTAIPGNLGYVFTTNYDQCIEAYLNDRRIEFEDGIERRHGTNIFQVPLINNPRRHPVLVKLHGSIDFFKTSEGNIISLQVPFASRREIEEKVLPLGIEIEDEVIIYPTETGTNRKVTESPFSDLYYQFRTAFQADPYLIIIGFSLRDRTICSILQDVLISGAAQGCKIFLIDPKAEEIMGMLRVRGFRLLSDTIRPVACSVDDPEIERILRDWAKGIT